MSRVIRHSKARGNLVTASHLSIIYVTEKDRKVYEEFDEMRFDERIVLSRAAVEREQIVPRAMMFAERMGVHYGEIKVLDLRFRWGSGTPKNSLNFNWRLIKAPSDVINYIIVHELAHLIEPNHTPEFWNIVSVQVPTYTKANEWLAENGSEIEAKP